jgi:DNA-directed RNA polymerase subunit RPC12/RpoP
VVPILKQLKCPKCGSRIIDSSKTITTEIRELPPEKDWKPDYFLKCWKCGSENGIKKTH